EPKGVVPELRLALVVEGDALVLGDVVPGRAANEFDLPARWSGRILSGAVLVIVLAVPVVNPLPLVSKHIEQVECVRLLCPHIVGSVAVVFEPLIEDSAASSVCLQIVILQCRAVQALWPTVVRIPSSVIQWPRASLGVPASGSIF